MQPFYCKPSFTTARMCVHVLNIFQVCTYVNIRTYIIYYMGFILYIIYILLYLRDIAYPIEFAQAHDGWRYESQDALHKQIALPERLASQSLKQLMNQSRPSAIQAEATKYCMFSLGYSPIHCCQCCAVSSSSATFYFHWLPLGETSQPLQNGTSAGLSKYCTATSSLALKKHRVMELWSQPFIVTCHLNLHIMNWLQFANIIYFRQNTCLISLQSS